MKVLIIEDETAASENLVAMLHEADRDIEVVKVLESVGQTVRWLSSNPLPDLIFMDIHLSDGSAFTLFQEIEVTTPIVFTTAYDQYALDAFAVNSLDYLLKPIKASELNRALDKFRRWTQSDVMAYLQRMMKMRPAEAPTVFTTSLLLPVKDRLVPVGMDEVAFIYSSGRKTQIHLKTGGMVPYNRSLDSIFVTLDPSRFFRANKQYIVARDCVKDIVVWFDSRLLLRMTTEVPEPLFVSKNKAAEFKNWLTTSPI